MSEKIKRALSLFFVFAILVSSLSFSVSAEVSQTKLRTICTNLIELFPKEYYSHAKEWDRFSNLISKTTSYLSSGEFTDEMNQTMYDDLKDSYKNIMHESFDFSGIYNGYSLAAKLDSTLFTEKSFNDYLAQADTAKSEYHSPTLYGTSTVVSQEKYQAYVQEKLNEVASNLNDKFNALEFVPQEHYSKTQLQSLVTIFETFITKDFFSYYKSYANFQTSLNAAKNTSQINKPTEKQLDDAANNLLRNYKTLFKDAADFSLIEKTIADFNELDPEEYIPSYYAKCKISVKNLESKLDDVFIFGYVKNDSAFDFEKAIKSRVDMIFSDVERECNNIPTLDNKETILAFIDYFNSIPIPEHEALAPFYAKLSTSVNNGTKIASYEFSTREDYENAISEIKNNISTYDSAVKSIESQSSTIFSVQTKRMRLLLGSILAAIVISMILAFVIERRIKDGDHKSHHRRRHKRMGSK